MKHLECQDIGSIIVADNILYKGYVMSDYNKHKQRTAVRNLREYIKLTLENPSLDSEILEVRRWALYKLGKIRQNMLLCF